MEKWTPAGQGQRSMGFIRLCSFFLNQYKYLVNLTFFKKKIQASLRKGYEVTHIPHHLVWLPHVVSSSGYPSQPDTGPGQGELRHLLHGCHSAERLSECCHLLYLPSGDIELNRKGTHRTASTSLKPLDGAAYVGAWAKPSARFPIQAVVTLPLHVCQPIRASRDAVILPSLKMKTGS